MGSPSQGIRTARRWLRELVPVIVLLALLFGSAALAWKLLTRPDPRPTLVINDAEKNAPPYFSVAAAAVDLEVVAPDGRRASTSSATAGSDSTRRLAADPNVDCGGYGREKESESSCTASIIVHEPAYGTWRVIVTSTDSTRGEALNVGYGGKGFRRAGGFPVRLIVDAHQSVEFSLSVAADGVSQTSKVGPSRR